jgi:pyruvate kinase
MALTPSLERARRLSLAWGLHCVRTEDTPHSMSEVVEWASRHALGDGFAKPGDSIVITAGLPFGTPGTTNMLRIVRA